MKSITTLAANTASISTIVLAQTLLAQTLFAQTERDLDSHEHGAAAMNIAVDKGTVFIELDSPWNNLIGFEHAPETDEQRHTVEEALAQLNRPEELFAFEGTACEIADIDIDSTIASGDEHDHDDEHKDGHDDHKDEHDDEHKDGHDDHKDEHDDKHEGEGDTHSEVRAAFSFQCKDSSKLSAIDVKLLGIWSGFEDLDVQLLGPGGQALVELGQKESVVDTAQVQ